MSLEDYEPVQDRLAMFWQDHPQGRVATELFHRDESQFIFRAELFRHEEDERPSATGWAGEVVGSSKVNQTSALENCETSALGRGLANLGYASKGVRPSREEMRRVESAAEPPPQAPAMRAEIAALAQEKGYSLETIESDFRRVMNGADIRTAGVAELAEYKQRLGDYKAAEERS
ncbi:hypothetical protein ABT324_00755 [Saccharopolyspora sp. NPDC000359]|uniref:hypothetical protein n=1 Tax=Saccharopolyspora sp. NPDC000359 TaxID=3154251 RepID=UPI003328BD1C